MYLYTIPSKCVRGIFRVYSLQPMASKLLSAPRKKIVVNICVRCRQVSFCRLRDETKSQLDFRFFFSFWLYSILVACIDFVSATFLFPTKFVIDPVLCVCVRVCDCLCRAIGDLKFAIFEPECFRWNCTTFALCRLKKKTACHMNVSGFSLQMSAFRWLSAIVDCSRASKFLSNGKTQF